MVAACCLQVRNTHYHRRDAPLKPESKEAHTTITAFQSHYGSIQSPETLSSFSVLLQFFGQQEGHPAYIKGMPQRLAEVYFWGPA